MRGGSVEAVFSGAPEDVEAMVALSREGPRYAAVEGVEVNTGPRISPTGFDVRPTE
jgi:acylphosphatase